MERQLIDYLPHIVSEYDVPKGIMAGQQPEFELAWNAANDLLNNQFVFTSGELGLSRWEKILKITPKGTDTIEDRRFRIITRLNEELPYTLKQLRTLLANLCGEGNYSAEVNDYTLNVKIALVAKSNFNDVVSLLHRVAPQNLTIDVALKYNRHSKLNAYTHAELAAYTQDQLRTEVFTDA